MGRSAGWRGIAPVRGGPPDLGLRAAPPVGKASWETPSKIDLASHTITVRAGKGNEDRVTVLAKALVPPLIDHLDTAKQQHDTYVRRGAGWVELLLNLRGGIRSPADHLMETPPALPSARSIPTPPSQSINQAAHPIINADPNDDE